MRSSLSCFTRALWHVLEPSRRLIWNWHLDAICLHLEAITFRRIRNLTIEIPPRCSKSTITSVFWPIWTWLHFPGARFLTASYDKDLATRDSTRSRRVLQADFFQRHFPGAIKLATDQNIKDYYENTKTGARIAIVVARGGTGKGGDYTLIDDPHDLKKAQSDQERLEAINWYDEAFYNRLEDISKAGRVVIGQRLHHEDLIGHIKSKEDPAWVHLCLPEEYDPERHCTTAIGWTDPRKEPGELLRPEQLPRVEVEGLKKILGPYAYEAQYQQNPSPRSGNLFPYEQLLKEVESLPRDCSLVRYWDKAGTQGGGAYTCGVLLARSPQGSYYVVDVVRGQWARAQRDQMILQTALNDSNRFGYVKIWIEQEPGSSGKEIAEIDLKLLEGFDVSVDRVTGDKLARAMPFAAQVQLGNVILLMAPWNDPYRNELIKFPAHTYKDQVDASSGAFNKLSLNQIVAIPEENFTSQSLLENTPEGVFQDDAENPFNAGDTDWLHAEL